MYVHNYQIVITEHTIVRDNSVTHTILGIVFMFRWLALIIVAAITTLDCTMQIKNLKFNASTIIIIVFHN